MDPSDAILTEVELCVFPICPPPTKVAVQPQELVHAFFLLVLEDYDRLLKEIVCRIVNVYFDGTD